MKRKLIATIQDPSVSLSRIRRAWEGLEEADRTNLSYVLRWMRLEAR
jgi:hypothetical protein